MKCKCGKEMEVEETILNPEGFDGISRLLKCECGLGCQEDYVYEDITPMRFWSDE